MARSKSLKVQNQLNVDNVVKCNRMLIKNYEIKNSDVQLFYQTDRNETNSTTPAFLNSNLKQQFEDKLQKQLQMNSNAKNSTKFDQTKSNCNLDRLKLELENNLKDNLNSTISTGNLTSSNSVNSTCFVSTKNLNDSNLVNDQNSTDQLNDCCNLEFNQNNHLDNSNNNLNDHFHKSINCEIVNNHLNNALNTFNLNNQFSLNQFLKPNLTTKKLFTKNNSVTTLDDNWSLNSKNLNSKHYPHQQNQQIEPNQQSTLKSNTVQHAINKQDLNCSTSGHLNELCTKSYWFFTCVNWKRRFCILEDHKLIIKDNQESKPSATIRLENYECCQVKLAKISKRTQNVIALHYSTEATPTSLLDFQIVFSIDSQAEMLKWLENIRKSISGARSSKKNGTRKRGKDDVQLESVEETKTLNVITKARPKGPKNRRLPKRQPVNNELNNSTTEQTIENTTTNEESQTDYHINGNQFKPNLNELTSHRLKSAVQSAPVQITSTQSTPIQSVSAQIKSNVPVVELIKNDDEVFEQQPIKQLIIDESNIKAMKQNLNKLRANSMSILDDDLSTDKTTDKVTNTSIKQDEDKKSNNKLEQKNEQNSVKQKREQLMQRLKLIEQTKNKCKSMVSLTSELETSRNNFFQLKSHNKSNDFLNRTESEINRSNSRSNEEKSGSCGDGLNSLNKNNSSKNNSSSNLIEATVDNVSSKVVLTNFNNNNSPSYLNKIKSTTLPAHQMQTTKEANLNVIGTLNSTKSNTISSNVSSTYRTALSSVSRNNSSSSSKSCSSTNSGSAGNGLNSTSGFLDNNNFESNSNGKSAAEASKLKKRIKNKKALNSKFYVQLDDETNLFRNSNCKTDDQTYQIDHTVSSIGNSSSNSNTHSNIHSNKTSNQANRNRTSLNLMNNVVEEDELTRKFREKGIGSVGNLTVII